MAFNLSIVFLRINVSLQVYLPHIKIIFFIVEQKHRIYASLLIIKFALYLK